MAEPEHVPVVTVWRMQTFVRTPLQVPRSPSKFDELAFDVDIPVRVIFEYESSLGPFFHDPAKTE